MWLAAGPSDLLGEGGRVGVFVILDGSGAIFTIVVEVYEYRDENVLALCLDGEAICIIGDDPTIVFHSRQHIACDLYLKALTKRHKNPRHKMVAGIFVAKGKKTYSSSFWLSSYSFSRRFWTSVGTCWYSAYFMVKVPRPEVSELRVVE